MTPTTPFRRLLERLRFLLELDFDPDERAIPIGMELTSEILREKAVQR